MINHISIPQYLLESSFCLAIFYLFYLILLKRETYFQFNRIYLIGTAFLSLFIPLINVDFSTASHLTGAEQLYPILYQVNDFQIGIQQTIAQDSNILHVSIADMINWVYMAGFFIMSLKLFSGLFKLFGIINRSPKMKDQDHTLLISEDVPAASFFSYIFWRDKHDKSDPIQKTIMDHEMVHVRQWHSLDVIVMELMVIVKWFNPLIYLFRNSLKKTHEFIADKYVTDQMGDKIEYANILLNNSGPTHMPPMSNHFYGNIKERIKMLGTKESNRLQQFKYFAIIPMTIMLFSLFSFDLSDKLPQPLKSSFQNIENSMLAAIETNVVSLNVDDEEEQNAFHLGWSDIMKIKLKQTNEIQEFIFSYSKLNLSQLLSDEPTILQNGKQLEIYIDTLEVITKTGKKEVSLESLKDDDFREFFIDSLNKFDQIMLGLKTYSDTDSLFIKLHLGLDKDQTKSAIHHFSLTDKTIKWGQRKIKFNTRVSEDGSRLNLHNLVTDEEFKSMLDNKLLVSHGSEKFNPFPEDMNISFLVSRTNNSKLSSVNSEWMDKFKRKNRINKNAVEIKSHYFGKEYSIQEESKSYSLKDFYKEKETFKDWMTSLQNGDMVNVKIFGAEGDFENYDFTLRYKDENQAIAAPFPIDLPHTTDAYSNFQIVMNDQGKSLVRIDTKNVRNRKIVDAYRGSESYEIIHIDNFKTKNRVRNHTLPRGILEIGSMYNPTISNLDIFTLNDYYTDADQLVRMDWGKMVSIPNIGNFSIKEFKRSSKESLTLFAGTELIEMARFDLLIIPENGKIKRLRTDKVNTQEIREILNNVDVNTSIYVDNIVVDVEGEYKYYPYNFVFTVE